MPPSTTDQSDQTAGARCSSRKLRCRFRSRGTVYDDGNFDNLQDNGEQGVANVTLTLLESNGNAVRLDRR